MAVRKVLLGAVVLVLAVAAGAAFGPLPRDRDVLWSVSTAGVAEVPVRPGIEFREPTGTAASDGYWHAEYLPETRTVAIDPGCLVDGGSARFLFRHELGHAAVHELLLGAEGPAAAAADLRRLESLGGGEPLPDGCVVLAGAYAAYSRSPGGLSFGEWLAEGYGEYAAGRRPAPPFPVP